MSEKLDLTPKRALEAALSRLTIFNGAPSNIFSTSVIDYLASVGFSIQPTKQTEVREDQKKS